MTFQCSKCRREKGFAARGFDFGQPAGVHPERRGRVDRVEMTGAAWPVRERRNARMALLMVEYKCKDCGHVGRSRHMDIVRKWQNIGLKIGDES